ncbi:MAG TPA: diaminopimelate epimerase [Vicinamibacterales bacterium]|nr:diaminopimelate epimerase [Vicinamibacterales bacterium]
MTVPFSKAHAYGNDFLLVPRGEIDEAKAPEIARAMCDRHMGIGADGLILFKETASGASMRLINADGSPSEVSGNGVRCLAAWLIRDLKVPAEATIEVEIETEAGVKRLTHLSAHGGKAVFRAAMGAPEGLHQIALDAGGEQVRAVVLRVGNPQCVVLGEVTQERLQRLGPALTSHPYFPEGTNVELATVEAPDRVRILIWERGVGPTLASGTGACASAVAAAAFGGAARAVDVVAPGGTQKVEWSDAGIFLTGWAETICEGRWLHA